MLLGLCLLFLGSRNSLYTLRGSMIDWPPPHAVDLYLIIYLYMAFYISTPIYTDILYTSYLSEDDCAENVDKWVRRSQALSVYKTIVDFIATEKHNLFC